MPCLRIILWMVLSLQLKQSSCNKDASRLFEDLLADYNKLVRPVDNNSETLIVRFKLKLSQLLDVVSASSFFSSFRLSAALFVEVVLRGFFRAK